MNRQKGKLNHLIQKSKVIQQLALVSVLALFTTNAFSQSPWVNKKGSFYGQLGYTYLAYTELINEGGNNIVESPFATSDITMGLFGDYSLTNKTAVIVNLPFKSVESNNQALSGLGDATIHIKHQLPGKMPLAVYYGYTAPLSQRDGILRTGYKQHAAELGLSGGVGKAKYYTYGALGYKYRTNIPDQVMIDYEFGYKAAIAKRTLYMMLHIDGAINTSSVNDDEAEETMLYHNDGEYLAPGLKFSYNAVGDFWINLGAFGAMMARKMGAAPTVSVGLAYDLKR